MTRHGAKLPTSAAGRRAFGLRRPAVVSQLVAILMCGALQSSLAHADVHLALVASPAQVALGADFNIELRITESGSLFNSYTATLTYEPGVVTYVPESFAWQEGPYMPSACGNTYQSFTAGTARLTFEHSLLCPGTSLTGPGVLYVLHFRAGNTAANALFEFSDLRFFNGGAPVPVAGSSLIVPIGDPTAAAEPPSTQALRIGPNPFHHRTVFELVAPVADLGQLRIYDARGRLVCDWGHSVSQMDSRRIVWDGRDHRGGQLPAGVYLASLSIGSHRIVRRLTILH